MGSQGSSSHHVARCISASGSLPFTGIWLRIWRLWEIWIRLRHGVWWTWLRKVWHGLRKVWHGLRKVWYGLRRAWLWNAWIWTVGLAWSVSTELWEDAGKCSDVQTKYAP